MVILQFDRTQKIQELTRVTNGSNGTTLAVALNVFTLEITTVPAKTNTHSIQSKGN
jgi:hypothetical protein